MIPFRNNIVRLISLIVGAQFLLSSGLAAQEVTGPPRGLKPPSSKAEEQKNKTANEGAVQTLGDRPGLSDGGIQVGTLAEVRDSNVGLLVPSTGGFPSTMWAGSDRLAVEVLLPLLPSNSPSHTMAELSRRLLLTAATVPSGVTKGRSFLELRMERLFYAGRFDEIGQLSAQVPSLAMTPAVAKYRMQALLLGGRHTEACELASKIEKEVRNQPFWLRTRAVCFALSGETAAADLTVGLMREQALNDDILFSLIEGISTNSAATLSAEGTLDALHLALLPKLKEVEVDNLLQRVKPNGLLALAANNEMEKDTRLQAAIMAEATGALSAAQLGELFDSIAFSEEELANPLSSAETLTPSLASALLYRAAKQTTVPSAISEIVASGLSLAREQQTYAAMARLYWPLLRGAAPSNLFEPIAADMVKLSLLQGEAGLARRWYDLARQSNTTSQEKLWDMQVLLEIAGVGTGSTWRPTDPSLWLEASKQNGPLFQRRVREILLLQGLGYQISPEAQIRMLEAPMIAFASVPSPVIRARLNNAQQGRRIGETILLSLITLGETGPAEASPDVLMQSHQALLSIGLAQEARQLLVEAIIEGQGQGLGGE